MRTLTIRNRFQENSTIIENDFIDHYMAKANGEYVKVYLLLLRHLNNPNASLTISVLADYLDCTEKDILRGLKYWSKVGLLKIDYDENGTICGLAIGTGSSNTEKSDKSEKPTESEKPQKKPSPKRPTSEEQEKLKQLYFVTEQYMGKPLSVTDIKKINYFFETLHFSTDLIEYLIEYCVENGHKSMHYIESVAFAWADKHITTVSEAKANTSLFQKNYFTILKAFGITGRNPAPIEVEYIKKWTSEYGFTLDIILEACNRTITYTAKPDFKYADSILKNWSAQKVVCLADIAKLDSSRKQEKSPSKKKTVKPSSSSSNGFNNFDGRSYDMTSLEQQLLNS